MKIKVSSIICFAVAALIVGSTFMPTKSDSPGWKDATYVKDAAVLPENEGKIVAISGHPEAVSDAEDPVVGVSFPSPYVERTVQRFTWKNGDDGWELVLVYEGQSDDGFEEAKLMGRVKIGDFELDQDLMNRVLGAHTDVKESDFSADDLAKMNANGHVIPEDFRCYYSTGPADYRNMNKNLEWSTDDWEGDYLVHWKMWAPKPEDAVTVVGVQKGDTLTYCELSAPSGNDKLMDEGAFYKEATTEVDPRPLSIVLALICVGMGVWMMAKGKGKKEVGVK